MPLESEFPWAALRGSSTWGHLLCGHWVLPCTLEHKWFNLVTSGVILPRTIKRLAARLNCFSLSLNLFVNRHTLSDKINENIHIAYCPDGNFKAWESEHKVKERLPDSECLQADLSSLRVNIFFFQIKSKNNDTNFSSFINVRSILIVFLDVRMRDFISFV